MADDVYLLVSDLDGTLVTTQTENGLNPLIVALAKRIENPFTAYYVCTARNYRNIEFHIGQYLTETRSDFFITHSNGDIMHANFNAFVAGLPSNATQLFIQETNLPLLSISTPDDLLFADCVECGDAYQKYYLPYEQDLLASYAEGNMTFPERKPIPDSRPHPSLTKDEQLKQIITHAKSKFPGKKLHLTFVDDRFKECLCAADVAEDDVEITIFWLNKKKLVPFTDACVIHEEQERENLSIKTFKGFLFNKSNAAVNAVCKIEVCDEALSTFVLMELNDWQYYKEITLRTLQEISEKSRDVKIILDGKIKGQQTIQTFTDLDLCDAFLMEAFSETSTSDIKPDIFSY